MKHLTTIKHPIIYHEAAHALVGYLVGMRVSFADMTGLTVGAPVVGLDVDPVPAPSRPRARALSALAGPIAEAAANGGHFNWRQDGKVAEIAAKALHNDDVEGVCVQLVEWAEEVRSLLSRHERTLTRIYLLLNERQFIGGDELTAFIEARVNDLD